jgi:DNA-binding CsgD family transcriptional regulator
VEAYENPVSRWSPYAIRRIVGCVMPRDEPVIEPEALSDAALAAHGLTRRESETLRHVATGATNDQIAARLDVSPRTVQKHLEHVYGKLGVGTRMAAIAKVGGRLA